MFHFQHVCSHLISEIRINKELLNMHYKQQASLHIAINPRQYFMLYHKMKQNEFILSLRVLLSLKWTVFLIFKLLFII